MSNIYFDIMVDAFAELKNKNYKREKIKILFFYLSIKL